MGNNTKKKVRSLPPLGKESKSKGKKKPEVGFWTILIFTISTAG